MTWLVKKAKQARFKTNEKETEKRKEDNTTFILDKMRDYNLQKNFLAFKEDNKNNCYRYNNLDSKKKNRLHIISLNILF